MSTFTSWKAKALQVRHYHEEHILLDMAILRLLPCLPAIPDVDLAERLARHTTAGLTRRARSPAPGPL